MNIETITLVTYILAGLGGVLLLLCCILMCLFIYTFCRNHGLLPQSCERQYRVASDQMDGDCEVALRRYEDIRPITTLPHKSSISIDPEKMYKTKKSPVTSRILRKIQKKNIEKESLVFTPEELDVPHDPPKFRKNPGLRKNRRSKSDWSLSSGNQDNEVLQGLMKHPPVQAESQYFDALGTLPEEEDDPSLQDAQHYRVEEESTDSSSWEDEAEEEKEFKPLKPLPKKRKPYLNQDQKKRLKALKNLQLESKTLESRFYVELFAVESLYWSEYKDKLYEKRRELVEPKDGSEGIPEFWLKAMMTSDTLKGIIQTHDLPILQHLIDIKIVTPLGTMESTSPPTSTFRLEFYFTPNEYFTDKFLYKDYTLRYGFTDTKLLKNTISDPTFLAHYEGRPQIVGCTGCKVHWNKGKNATLRPIKKLDKSTGKQVTKFAKRNSFFNFFTPPKVTTGLQGLPDDPSKISLMEAHFEIGLFLKETFVPKAFSFYLDSYIDSKVPKEAKKAKKKESEENSHKKASGEAHKWTENKRPHSYLINNNSICSNGSIPKTNGNGIIVPHSEPHDYRADPIVGRYKMVSSEGFDEWMKALGVGMVRRKLANSITPVNVVEISDDGVYTIRTETSVRTTEIKFKLNEEFDETTIDGRVTKTTAIRSGNKLILEQKGDASKKEKDTKMIRDFNGDIMNMQLILNDIICNRRYERIDGEE